MNLENFNPTQADFVNTPDIELITTVTLAIKYHGEQTDYTGIPFYHHLFRVAAACSPEPFAMCVALLHDVVEDTETSLDDIVQTYGPFFAGHIDLLTRREGAFRDGGETYAEYITRLIQGSLNCPVALIVKRADLLDNLAPWRQTFNGWERLAARHEAALYFVEKAMIERGLLSESKKYTSPFHLDPRAHKPRTQAKADHRPSDGPAGVGEDFFTVTEDGVVHIDFDDFLNYLSGNPSAHVGDGRGQTADTEVHQDAAGREEAGRGGVAPSHKR